MKLNYSKRLSYENDVYSLVDSNDQPIHISMKCIISSDGIYTHYDKKFIDIHMLPQIDSLLSNLKLFCEKQKVFENYKFFNNNDLNQLSKIKIPFYKNTFLIPLVDLNDKRILSFDFKKEDEINMKFEIYVWSFSVRKIFGISFKVLSLKNLKI